MVRARPRAPGPVRVELVGMFPLTFRTCARAVGMAGCGPGDDVAQQAEYPPDVLAQQRLAEEAAANLWTAFGAAVRVESVLFTSPRGLWLSLRHRLGQDPVAFVDGRGPIPLAARPAAVQAAISAALSRRPEALTASRP